MNKVEWFVESVILGARWLLVIFLGGLAIALGVYGLSFGVKLFKVITHVFDYGDEEMILAMLGLIDAALVASLIVMVMIASYENFVGRFIGHEAEIAWLGKLDSGSLKIKVASSIVAISSIHLLQVFLNVDHYTDSQIMWLTAMHITFVVSALLLGFLEKIMAAAKH